MKHQQKVNLARRKQSSIERKGFGEPGHKRRGSIWNSAFWNERKLLVKVRVMRREAIATARAAERRAKLAA